MHLSIKPSPLCCPRSLLQMLSIFGFAQRLYAEQNVTVLPGRFLARDHEGVNPGENRVRMALVAPLDECVDAARRINSLLAAL